MTWEELYQSGRRRLEAAGVPEAAYDAHALLEMTGGPDRTHYPLDKSETVPAGCEGLFDALIGARANRVPLQHILGESWFMGLPFAVSEEVLIPRSETELLVEEVLKTLPEAGRNLRLLDLCTGSGCIGIALARLGRFKKLALSDLSEEALAVARDNARRHRVLSRLQFYCGDMLGAVRIGGRAVLARQQFDVVCCNPPYIPTAEINGLMPEVRDHDPFIALDGGADGLDFYRTLARELPGVLTPGGYLFLEIGEDQGESVPALLTAAGFEEIRVKKDLAGLDRLVTARRPREAAHV